MAFIFIPDKMLSTYQTFANPNLTENREKSLTWLFFLIENKKILTFNWNSLMVKLLGFSKLYVWICIIYLIIVFSSSCSSRICSSKKKDQY